MCCWNVYLNLDNKWLLLNTTGYASVAACMYNVYTYSVMFEYMKMQILSVREASFVMYWDRATCD